VPAALTKQKKVSEWNKKTKRSPMITHIGGKMSCARTDVMGKACLACMAMCMYLLCELFGFDL
jgi:hypothetical protein